MVLTLQRFDLARPQTEQHLADQRKLSDKEMQMLACTKCEDPEGSKQKEMVSAIGKKPSCEG